MPQNIVPITRVLMSVTEKKGIGQLGAFFSSVGVEILSTGGTAKELRDKFAKVVEVSDYTGFPEAFDGQVKSIHPKIAGGILYKRDNPDHVKRAKELGIEPIDAVMVNFYDFVGTALETDDMKTVIKNIDIGGPSLVRAAAKNADSVVAIVDPDDYPELRSEYELYGGTTGIFRERMQEKAFRRTRDYDASIHQWFHMQEQRRKERVAAISNVPN